MAERYRDFDSCWGEMEKSPVVFKAYGREYQLPASLPAETALRIMRIRKDADGIPRSGLADIAVSLLGREQLDDLAEKGLTASELGELLQWILSVYTEQPEEDSKNSIIPRAERRGK
jgi:hypothetical protein